MCSAIKKVLAVFANIFLQSPNKVILFWLKITLLNKRLLSIRVPDVITRCPRSLADRGTWKGKYDNSIFISR